MEVLGTFQARFQYLGKIYTAPIVVVRELGHNLILGYDFWRTVGLHISHPVDEVTASQESVSSEKSLKKLSSRQQVMFEEAKKVCLMTTKDSLGRTPILQPDIKSTERAKPFYARPNLFSPGMEKRDNHELDLTLSQDIVALNTQGDAALLFTSEPKAQNPEEKAEDVFLLNVDLDFNSSEIKKEYLHSRDHAETLNVLNVLNGTIDNANPKRPQGSVGTPEKAHTIESPMLLELEESGIVLTNRRSGRSQSGLVPQNKYTCYRSYKQFRAVISGGFNHWGQWTPTRDATVAWECG